MMLLSLFAGRAHNIVVAERVVLNFMQRMSGIATLTKVFLFYFLEILYNFRCICIVNFEKHNTISKHMIKDARFKISFAISFCL